MQYAGSRKDSRNLRRPFNLLQQGVGRFRTDGGGHFDRTSAAAADASGGCWVASRTSGRPGRFSIESHAGNKSPLAIILTELSTHACAARPLPPPAPLNKTFVLTSLPRPLVADRLDTPVPSLPSVRFFLPARRHMLARVLAMALVRVRVSLSVCHKSVFYQN